MTIGLDDEQPAPEWPEGITVRTYRRDEDENAVYEAHQETFSDHEDFVRDTIEDWRQWSFRDGFDPELWFLAVDRDDVVGICLCRPERAGDDSFGCISVAGVRRPWRRRGVGLALLRHAFDEFRARGKTRAGLGVDADNPTGAARLYERAGMTTTRRSVWYEKPAT